VTRDGTWLIDVRPGTRIEEADRVRFAAAAEAALSCGWRYAVAAGWLPNVQVTLDTLSAHRRPLRRAAQSGSATREGAGGERGDDA
jgi:hypothetical protein